MLIAAIVVCAGALAVLAGAAWDTWHDHTPPDPCDRRPVGFRYRPPGW